MEGTFSKVPSIATPATPATPALHIRGCAQEIGRRDGTGETERPKPERRFGKGKLAECGRGVGNFATLGYDRD